MYYETKEDSLLQEGHWLLTVGNRLPMELNQCWLVSLAAIFKDRCYLILFYTQAIFLPKQFPKGNYN